MPFLRPLGLLPTVAALAAAWIEIFTRLRRLQPQPVAALAAAWIEIHSTPSRPTCCPVAALAAAWIEIGPAQRKRTAKNVAALAAAWIEMPYTLGGTISRKSRPLRPRGLKYPRRFKLSPTDSRGPCGRVD